MRPLLLERARTDARIVGAAITGSAARDAEDRWSDIDLFFGVADGAVPADVLADWSDFVVRELGAVHHFDLHAGAATYRAFLLGDGLEVDLAFTPAGAFGPLGTGAFRVVFGEAAPRQAGPGAGDAGHLVGLAWHHVLHARTAIERGAPWQAEYWISGVRDQTLALGCLRLGEPAHYAKGADALPIAVTGGLEDALVRSLELEELRRALRVAATGFLLELAASDAVQGHLLERPIRELADLAEGPLRDGPC